MLPNFLVLGAAKAGTTSIYHYLKQHPEVYVTPTKETNFFALEGQKPSFSGPGDDSITNRFSITNIINYKEQFDKVTNETALGEVCPLYLYSEKAPERIKHYVPEVKLIAILRNPIDRAYATFMHRFKRETTSDFMKALAEEEYRISKGWDHLWHYTSMGFYSQQLQRYYALFSKDQIKVYLYEDLCNDPVDMMQDLYRFINVSDNFIPNTTLKFGVSGISKSKFVESVLHQLNKEHNKRVIRKIFPEKFRHLIFNFMHTKNTSKKPMPQKAKLLLIEIFKEDIENLQDLLNKDLSHWLS